jgi:hypothetical protein
MRNNRDVVLARSGGYCERCGIPLANDWALHHRKLRKHGGDNSPANLMALHHHCHNLGTDSVHLNPANAYAMGWLVRSTQDPEFIAMRLPNGTDVLLTTTGDYLSAGLKMTEDGERNGW